MTDALIDALHREAIATGEQTYRRATLARDPWIEGPVPAAGAFEVCFWSGGKDSLLAARIERAWADCRAPTSSRTPPAWPLATTPSSPAFSASPASPNACAGDDRYPTVTPESLRELDPDAVLLSSEPFPFEAKRADAWSNRTGLPRTRFQRVDGELPSGTAPGPLPASPTPPPSASSSRDLRRSCGPRSRWPRRGLNLATAGRFRGGCGRGSHRGHRRGRS